MLIQALCDYYDVLSRASKLVPDGYSTVRIHYRVSLTPDGRMDGIEAWMVSRKITDIKGKEKEVLEPRPVEMFRRTEKPGIEANFVEHRPVYIFGLMPEEDKARADELTPVGKNAKAQKSHKAFVERNLAFTEGIDSPIVNAFRAFLKGWKPEDETQNSFLKALGKGYSTAGFAFCLSGQPDVMLHKDEQLAARWEEMRREQTGAAAEHLGQCAITGEEAEIAVLHDRISGVMGGLATGTKLVCFNNESESSYGASQAVNSCISEDAMHRYTQALNFLTGSKLHKTMLGDVTTVHFAMSDDKRYDAISQSALFGARTSQGADTDGDGADKSADNADNADNADDTDDADDGENTLSVADTELLLSKVYAEAREGNANAERLLMERDIDPSVNYYIIGLKPNSSRLAVKFVYRRRFGELIGNVAQHQADMAIGTSTKPVAIWQIMRQMVSPKATKENRDKVDPALSAKLLESVMYGYRYPQFLLATMVRRVRTDSDTEESGFIKLNPVRAGVIKACLNRVARLDGKKEEIKMALDKENTNPAYLCGRLFAVLERVQELANPGLNRTITDAYFASASSRPSLVFPRLIKLSKNHLKKLEYEGYWNRRIGEIIAGLCGEYPDTLSLPDQGRFMIGYYQEKYAPAESKQDAATSNKEEK